MVGVGVKAKLNNSLSSHPLMKHPKPINTATTTAGVPSFKILADPPTGNVKINNAHHPSLLNPQPQPKEEECKRKPSLNGGRRVGSASASKSGLNSLEKNKGKLHNSGKSNVGRKVLADISNVRANFSKAKAQDRSKSLSISRNSLVGTHTGSCLSRKPFNGIGRTDLTQITGNYHPVKKVVYKDTKAISDDLRTKSQSTQLTKITNSRTYGGIRLPPTRKSFPVIKQVNKASTEISDRGKESYGFPVNSKAGRNVASRVSNKQDHLWKNRVTDGYTMMASKDQRDMDVEALSRRSLKPMLTTTVKIERTSNLRSVSGFKKLVAGSDISSKKKDEKAKLSSTKNIGSAMPITQLDEDEVSSFDNSNSERTAVDNVAKKKPNRRKSFTFLLMSRSKEDLPNIYDAHNHLEVTEYIDDIYHYYWVMEAQNQPLKQYMEIQTEITPQMRGILINWLIEVHLKFDLMQETLFLMVTLLDQFLSSVSIKKNKMQLVGLTALLLASKYEDFWHPRIMDLIGISADSYTRDEMLKMESAFLKALKFRLNAPTPYVFMLRFLKASQSDKKFEHLAFYLIELCIVEYEALKYKPSLLCASAIYVARCTMQMTPTWTPLLGKHSRYDESQIRQCAEMILKFHKSAETAMLKVTYEKYMRLDFSRVAAINPLEMLPQ